MESSDNYVHRLQEIGLSRNEAQVYIALLTIGTGTAYHVAQACDVKKPTVYGILEDLRAKGLVLKVPHAKKALFSARDIEEYLGEQRSRLRAVEAIAPQLALLSSRDRSNVFFFSGVRGVEESTRYKLDSMRDHTFHSLYGNLEGCSPEVMAIFERWEKDCVDSGILFEIIMQKKEADLYYQNTMVLAKRNPKSINLRFLEKSVFPGHISLEIGPDFIRIIDAKNLYATIIDDAATAQAMLQIFTIAWESGK